MISGGAAFLVDGFINGYIIKSSKEAAQFSSLEFLNLVLPQGGGDALLRAVGVAGHDGAGGHAVGHEAER